ncbi:hypothetical protein ACIRVF_19750 [Kitasatospora sp. NPDC101157]|uniref:hypothetical protein n=1 Tax=Kitasatospora sp. NPDC101157 TaxID=3364098 RepID=UPI00380AE78D
MASLILGCAACAGGAGGGRTVIEQADLVGDWGNKAGARLHIAADHSATVSGLEHAVPDTSCSTAEPAAQWVFWAPMDAHSSVADATATKGDSFDLELAPGARTSERTCSATAVVQRDGEGYDLCLVQYADQSCTDGELLRKLTTSPG